MSQLPHTHITDLVQYKGREYLICPYWKLPRVLHFGTGDIAYFLGRGGHLLFLFPLRGAHPGADLVGEPREHVRGSVSKLGASGFESDTRRRRRRARDVYADIGRKAARLSLELTI